MGIASLSKAVGTPGKSGNASKVKNSSGDVEVLRRMLNANGYSIPETGKFDSRLGAMIKAVQKKSGVTPVDGVVMPGDKMCKALAPKYLAEEKRAAKVEMLTYKVGGKTYEVLPKDEKKLAEVVFRQVTRPTRALIGRINYTMDRYQFYLDTAMAKDGIAMAMVQASIMFIGRIKFPDDKKMMKALKAKGQLENALASKNLKLYCAAMRTAEKDINAFVAEFQDFVKRMEGKGGQIQGALEVVSSTSFAAVEILAVPVIVTYTRLPPDKAYMMSKTSVAGIESLAKDLGKHISGQKVTVAGSLGRAGGQMAKELVLSWFGGKIKFKGPLLNKSIDYLVGPMGKAFPFIPQKYLRKYIGRYLRGAGEEAGKSILKSMTSAVETWLKQGRAPSGAEFEKMFKDLIQDTVLGGVSRNLTRFNSDWAKKNQELLRHKIFLKAFIMIDRDKLLTDKMRSDIIDKSMGKLEDQALKLGYDSVFAEAKGDESSAALVSKAQKAVISNSAISAEVKAIVEAELRKASK